MSVRISLVGDLDDDEPEDTRHQVEDILRRAEASISHQDNKVVVREPELQRYGWEFARGLSLAAHIGGLRFAGFHRGLRLEYEVRVPRDTKARIRSENGSLGLAAILGPVSIETENGRTSVEAVDRVVTGVSATRALIEAACDVKAEGYEPVVELMFPLVAMKDEFDYLKAEAETVIAEVLAPLALQQSADDIFEAFT